MQDSSPLNNQVRVRVLVSGRVQGVGYRMSTWEVANELGLKGWVRNLPDGRVEGVFEGSRDVIEEMIGWCHQGNPSAVVKNVVFVYEEPEGIHKFEIRR